MKRTDADCKPEAITASFPAMNRNHRLQWSLFPCRQKDLSSGTSSGSQFRAFSAFPKLGPLPD